MSSKDKDWSKCRRKRIINRIEELRRVPAYVIFLSCEPLIGVGTTKYIINVKN